jgi:hypothetical protein
MKILLGYHGAMELALFDHAADVHHYFDIDADDVHHVANMNMLALMGRESAATRPDPSR